MVHFVKEALDVHIHDGSAAFLYHVVAHPAYGVMSASARTVSIAVVAEQRLEHLRQRLRDRLLDHAVLCVRDIQLAFAPSRFRDGDHLEQSRLVRPLL